MNKVHFNFVDFEKFTYKNELMANHKKKTTHKNFILCEALNVDSYFLGSPAIYSLTPELKTLITGPKSVHIN